MAGEQIRLVGGPELIAKLQAEPDFLMKMLEVAVAKGLLEMQRQLATYPRQDALSAYHRTGQLGRLWTSVEPVWEARSNGFMGSIGNTTSYGPYVQDETKQNPNNDAWLTVQMALWDNEGNLVLYLGEAIAEAIKPLND